MIQAKGENQWVIPFITKIEETPQPQDMLMENSYQWVDCTNTNENALLSFRDW